MISCFGIYLFGLLLVVSLKLNTFMAMALKPTFVRLAQLVDLSVVLERRAHGIFLALSG
jgi:hypothetical protein